MRILEVMAGAPHGGAETAFVDMCIALHEAGETVEVATRANDLRVGQLVRAGIPVHCLGFGGPLDIVTPMRLRRIIRDFRPKIVQTWMSRASQKVPAPPRNKAEKDYVVTSRLGGYYKVKHFPHTDYFTTITPDIKRHLVDGGVAAERITHINNFAETEEGATPVDRASLDTPEDAPVLVSLSRLHRAKAIDTLLYAVAKVPEVYLWIAGDGPDRAALEELSAELGLTERVRFLGWRDDRSALLQAADICVFPSRFEPFGTVFVQAWAERTPVLVTPAEGPRQYVRDGEDCVLVPIDDVDALADGMRRLISDPDLAAKLVENGYNRYRNEFEKSKVVDAYLAHFRDIMAKEGITEEG